MIVYIAARFDQKQNVRDAYKQLENKGFEISSDWTIHKTIKPYIENQITAKKYSIEDVDGARNCDIFIIFSNEAGTGMYVELGAAIASYIEHGKPKIYVVGNQNSRAMFYFHPSVNRRKTLEEVLREI